MKTTTENKIEIPYNLSFLKRPQWILGLFALFFIVFFNKLSLLQRIDQLILTSLTQNKACPVQLKDYNINFFPLPHLHLSKLTIPKHCYGGAQNLFFENVKTYFYGPSFFPFGIKFHTETELKQNPIEVGTVLGLGTVVLTTEKMKLSLTKLSSLIPQVKLAGNILTDAYIKISNEKLEEINLKLQSKDFIIPSQNLSGFELVQMPVKNLYLSLVTENKQIAVKSLIVGDEKSPLRSELSGKIKLNQKRPLFSTLDLSGQLSIDDQILENNFLLKSYLGQFDRKDGFYQLKLSGSLNRPKLTK